MKGEEVNAVLIVVFIFLIIMFTMRRNWIPDVTSSVTFPGWE